MRKSTRLGFVVFSLSALAAPLAHGIPFDPSGNKDWRTPPTPPRVAPATSCVVGNYAAFANPADTEMDSYMFSGWCTVNVAPESKDPVMQKVNVQVAGEWFPKMKRASEAVKIFHTDKTFTFSTWATCDKDPFLMGSTAACKDQGMGGQDFSLFIRKEDAPLGKSRVNPAAVAALTAKVTARAQIRTIGTLKTMEIDDAEIPVGQEAKVKTTFAGGPGACPMQVDFGDGYVQQAVTSEQTTYDLAGHAYTKPGLYTIKAKSLPGCSGEVSVKVAVKAASVEAVKEQAGPTKAGQPAGILISGRSGICKMSVDFGDGKVETVNTTFGANGTSQYLTHIYYEPGRKNLKATGTEGCNGTAAGYVDVSPGTVKSLKSTGAVPPFQTFRLITDGACHIRMDWGDGVVEEMNDATFLNGQVTVSHQFKKKGKLLVQARGTDGCLGVVGEWITIN